MSRKLGCCRSDRLKVCDCNIGEEVTSYCEDHDQICCRKCLRQNHRSCRSLLDIARASAGITTTQLCKGMPGRMQTLVNKYKSLRTSAHRVQSTLSEYKEECLQHIRDVRKEINNVFDQLQKEIEFELENVSNVSESEMMYNLQTCDESLKSLKECLNKFEKTVRTRNDVEVFVQLKHAQTVSEKHSRTLAEIRQACTNLSLEFKPNEDMLEFTKALPKFGKVIVIKGAPQVQVSLPPAEQLTATLLEDQSVYTPRDDYRCCVRGVAPLDSGQILVADYSNQKLKLFDDQFINLFSMQLSSGPGHMSLSGESLAVTLPDERKVQLLKVKDETISSLSIFSTVDPCRGIVHLKDGFLAMTMENKVVVTNKTGKVRKCLQKDKQGASLFKKPCGLTADKDNLIYVADEYAGLVCVSFFGEVLRLYSELVSPQSVAIDTIGNVYVGGSTSRTVDVISVSGDRMKRFISHTKGLRSAVLALGFNGNSNILAVSMSDSNSVLLYKLS